MLDYKIDVTLMCVVYELAARQWLAFLSLAYGLESESEIESEIL